MGASAKAAHEAGGEVLGIMPRFLLQKERLYDDVEHRLVDDMHTRKQMMFDEADAFIVLPGGIGTLEEAVEILSWARLSLHAKPLAFLDEDGFWDPFFEMMDQSSTVNSSLKTSAPASSTLIHRNSRFRR